MIPVPHRSKNPGFDGWQRLRLTAETIHDHFNGQPQNIGVLLGEPSGWLIDVDLDHPRAVELAAQFLPPTPAIFGRAGKPRSHWLYRVTAPVATKKYKSKSAGMIVELRSTGTQTVFPPSTHESGEADCLGGRECGASLGRSGRTARLRQTAGRSRARRTRGEASDGRKEKSVPRARGSPSSDDQPQSNCGQGVPLPGGHAADHFTDHRDGSHRLFVAACRAVEHDLDDATALATISQYARQRPFPRGWTDEEILQRLRDAEKQCRRGAALELDAEGCVPLGHGTRNPASWCSRQDGRCPPPRPSSGTSTCIQTAARCTATPAC